MAEFIFRHLCEQAGIENRFHIASMAVSTEETGNDIYPPLIICADRSNLRAIERMFGTSPKLTLMMHWAGEDRDVSDPWYTRDFDTAFRDIYTACEGLLKHFSTPQKII